MSQRKVRIVPGYKEKSQQIITSCFSEHRTGGEIKETSKQRLTFIIYNEIYINLSKSFVTMLDLQRMYSLSIQAQNVVSTEKVQQGKSSMTLTKSKPRQMKGQFAFVI